MNMETAWAEFERTGSVEAYLRYRELSAMQNNNAVREGTINAADHRRTDHPSSQYWG